MLETPLQSPRATSSLPPEAAQALAQHSPAVLLTLDATGTICYANPSALILLGRSEHQLIGMAFLSTLDAGSRNKWRMLLEAAPSGPTPTYELNQLGTEGRIILIGYQAVPIQAGEAKVLLIGQPMHVAVAVTERLIAANRRLEALFQIAAVVARALALPEALKRALEVTLNELDLHAGVVLVSEAPIATTAASRTQPTFICAAQHGFAPALTNRLDAHVAHLAGGALPLDRPFHISGSADELGLDPAELLAPSGLLFALATIPLLSENRLMGRMIVLSHRYSAFGEHELDTLATIGQLLGPLIEHAQLDQIKDEFVAAAAHDLKTPVTAVKGYAQIALRLSRHIEQPRLLHQLEMINARSDDLAYLMDTLLDMSRIQGGRLQLDLESVLLSELIEHVLNHFEFDLKRQARAIDIELPDGPLEVRWDGLRIERMLINLFNNALKYTPNRSAIELYVQHLPATDELVLSVTDSGVGVAPDEREHIFERFYRTRQTIQDGIKGSGIGLYICRSVVELHGGHIWAADARHGGPGLTIYARLPRVAEPSPMV
jgi:PAS domain S-box-containing protein